jgi:hypothetical protein
MRILRDANDRLQFIVDFVNRKDLSDTMQFTDPEVKILQTEFKQFLTVQSVDQLRNDLDGFLPTVLPPKDRDFRSFGRSDFLKIQKRLCWLLDEVIYWQDLKDETEFEKKLQTTGYLEAINAVTSHPMVGSSPKLAERINSIISVIRKKRNLPEITLGEPITVSISSVFVFGDRVNLVMFVFLMLLRQATSMLLRCPNWESRICKQKYFLKQGKSIYCSLRCGNAFRVKRSLDNKKNKARVKNLVKQKMGSEEISRRLHIDSERVSEFLKKTPKAKIVAAEAHKKRRK